MQSEALGMGIDYLEQHSHIWMLTGWQIRFNRRPGLSEEIVTGTWAYDFDAMYGYRNFILKGAGDETLAVANSIWVLINTHTGRPEKLTMEAVEGYGRGASWTRNPTSSSAKEERVRSQTAN